MLIKLCLLQFVDSTFDASRSARQKKKPGLYEAEYLWTKLGRTPRGSRPVSRQAWEDSLVSMMVVGKVISTDWNMMDTSLVMLKVECGCNFFVNISTSMS